jgi:hypothetical protein
MYRRELGTWSKEENGWILSAVSMIGHSHLSVLQEKRREKKFPSRVPEDTVSYTGRSFDTEQNEVCCLVPLTLLAFFLFCRQTNFILAPKWMYTIPSVYNPLPPNFL